MMRFHISNHVSIIATISIFLIVSILDIYSLQNKRLELQQKVFVIEREIKVKKKIFRSKKQKEKSMESISLQTVSGLEEVKILGFLEDAMFATWVKPILFEPLKIKKQNLSNVYPIKLELVGGYKALLDFINRVLSFPYLVVIEDLVLENIGGSGGDLRMRVLFLFHKNKDSFRQEVNEDFKFLSPEILANNVFTKRGKRKGLGLWRSRELRFLGRIKKNEKVFGVIGDPLGGVYQVGVGDLIGLNKNKIVMIGKDQIATDNPKENIYRGE